MYSNLPRMADSIQHLDFSLSRPLMFRAVIRLLAALALLFEKNQQMSRNTTESPLNVYGCSMAR